MDNTQAQQDQAQFDAAYGRVVTRAWSDPTYKSRLMADPHGVLAEAGLSVAPEVKINVIENSDKVLNIVLPPPLEEGVLSHDELDRIAGGNTCAATGCTGKSNLPLSSFQNLFRSHVTQIMTYRR
jgi:hypothetical protein